LEQGNWLDNIVTTNTINVVKKTFKVLYKKKRNEKYKKLKKILLKKLMKVQDVCQKYSRIKSKIMP
jgi:ribosomal protein S5